MPVFCFMMAWRPAAEVGSMSSRGTSFKGAADLPKAGGRARSEASTNPSASRRCAPGCFCDGDLSFGSVPKHWRVTGANDSPRRSHGRGTGEGGSMVTGAIEVRWHPSPWNPPPPFLVHPYPDPRHRTPLLHPSSFITPPPFSDKGGGWMRVRMMTTADLDEKAPQRWPEERPRNGSPSRAKGAPHFNVLTMHRDHRRSSRPTTPSDKG